MSDCNQRICEYLYCQKEVKEGQMFHSNECALRDKIDGLRHGLKRIETQLKQKEAECERLIELCARIFSLTRKQMASQIEILNGRIEGNVLGETQCLHYITGDLMFSDFNLRGDEADKIEAKFKQLKSEVGSE